MLTETDVKYTLNALCNAGKRMPRDIDGRLADKDKVISIWHKTFQNTELPTWQRATTIALTMTESRQANINLISTALMQEAIFLATNERLLAMREKEEKLKKDELADKEIIRTSDKLSYKMQTLTAWTKRKLEKGEPFRTDKITEEEINTLGRQLGLDEKEIDYNKSLLKIYLSDKKYMDSLNRDMEYNIFITESRQVAFSIDFS